MRTRQTVVLICGGNPSPAVAELVMGGAGATTSSGIESE